MRGLPLLAVVVLLAGCNAPAAEEPPTEAPDEDPGRTARGGGVGDDEADVEDLRPIELLRTPLTMAGQGPESFDVTVPAGLVSVAFAFNGGATFNESGLRVELSGCGTYDAGAGFSSSTGSGYYSAKLCDEPAAGPATVTIAATLIVFDGTFILTGYAPMDASASVGNETADG
ncbi:MAG TPA: hypothetical protein VJ874_04000 [Candidatus Thermoplasmatota archaeon]|nr:hypothetical protein [Candidatus Thermoplasmatota archaeon]